MMADAHANFAVSNVVTAPSPATSGTSLVVTSGQGALFPTAPFNATVCPNGQAPTTTNAEIVRVTAIATDTFTITRAQESSTARSVIVGDQIFASPTKKTFTDVESQPYGWTTFTGNQATNNSSVNISTWQTSGASAAVVGNGMTVSSTGLTVPTAGLYLITFFCRGDVAATTQVQVQPLKGGGLFTTPTVSYFAIGPTSHMVSFTLTTVLAANDLMGVTVFSNAAGTFFGSAAWANMFSVTRLSS